MDRYLYQLIASYPTQYVEKCMENKELTNIYFIKLFVHDLIWNMGA